MNSIATVTNALEKYESQFVPLLAQSDLPVAKLIQTIITSCQMDEKLLQCSQQSIMNSAITAACLGLPVDGVTGQAYLLPFAKKAQLVIGYKGYNTLAWRAGYTVNGACVYDDDRARHQSADHSQTGAGPHAGPQYARCVRGSAPPAAAADNHAPAHDRRHLRDQGEGAGLEEKRQPVERPGDRLPCNGGEVRQAPTLARHARRSLSDGGRHGAADGARAPRLHHAGPHGARR